jgi:hypothetical protein
VEVDDGDEFFEFVVVAVVVFWSVRYVMDCEFRRDLLSTSYTRHC